jgi:hypothetical protein
MVNVIKGIKINILKNKGLIAVILLTFSLLIPSIFTPSHTEAAKKSNVLGVVSNAKSKISNPQITITPTPQPTNAPTLTPTPTLTPSPIPTEDITPTPVGLKIQIGVDYAGQKAADSYTVSVNPGQTAWDAVAAAVGINHLQYTDYGGNMGIFITGFNGINADSSHYFEFQVNSVSSNAGVSSYKCNDGDKLDFVLTSF